MSKQTVRILSDATMDLPAKIVKELDIGILPTQIMIDDREKPYRNYIDITPEEFWEKLSNCKEIPTTAVPKQGDVFKTYEESLKDFESLIVFGHSSKISSSYNLAKKVADQMFPEKDITVIDSQTITILQGLLVNEAATIAATGAPKEKILERMYELIPHSHGVAVINSLDHLRKGGRITVAQHILGSLIGFKPMICIEDGIVQNLTKVRGFRNALDLIKENIPKILNQRKLDHIKILHALQPDEAKELQEFILSQDDAPASCDAHLLGPILGAHLGPYALGIGWIGNWDWNWWKK